MALSDLNNLSLSDLDLKNLANAPAAVKGVVLAILFALIVAAGYYFHLADQVTALDAMQAEETTLRDTYSAKVGETRNLDIYRKQLEDTEAALSTMLKQLPGKAEIDALLTDINQAGLGRGLNFELFRPGQTSFADYYATLPVSIKVHGTYHEIASFISDVAALPRIVTVHDLNFAPDAKPPTLSMEATLRTYRYLDDAESAAAKQGGKK
ncbi:MAG: type 4a pilus biogenesis protein PilO [Betaproteobacteria bacterium]|nr:type 4a pilus biogenesis protein PilO [Betaproteobacteria bacterium]